MSLAETEACFVWFRPGVAVPSSQDSGLASDPAIFCRPDDFDLSPE